MTSDKKYISWLFQSYYSDLYKYGLKICMDEDLTKDCIQDIFTRIWKSQQSFSDIKNIKAYLFEALRRTIFTQIKKNKSRNEKNNNVHLDLVMSHEEELVENESLQNKSKALYEAMKKLTKRQKEVIRLKYLEGMDYEEIEQTTNLKYKTIRNLSSEATKVLRRQLSSLVFSLLVVAIMFS